MKPGSDFNGPGIRPRLSGGFRSFSAEHENKTTGKGGQGGKARLPERRNKEIGKQKCLSMERPRMQRNGYCSGYISGRLAGVDAQSGHSESREARHEDLSNLLPTASGPIGRDSGHETTVEFYGAPPPSTGSCERLQAKIAAGPCYSC